MDAAGIARQRTVMPDDTVARDDDRDAVVVVRHSHRSRCSGLSQFFGDLAVRPRLAVGNLQQFAPHGNLKRRALKIEREVELGPPPLEVFLYLGLADAVRLRIESRPLWNALTKMNRSEPLLRRGERQHPYGRVDHNKLHGR